MPENYYLCSQIETQYRDNMEEQTKLTREEALRRWNASKETKRRLMAKLEGLVRDKYQEKTGKEPLMVESW